MDSSKKPLPVFFISHALLEQRTSAFVGQKNNLLSEALGKPDTRNIWYSRDHIAGLLDEIDHSGGDGLRVYFGMYEPGHPHEGQLCLVMNATRGAQIAGHMVHSDIITEQEPDFAERLGGKKGGLDAGGGLPDEQVRGYNLGSPCPPICE